MLSMGLKTVLLFVCLELSIVQALLFSNLQSCDFERPKEGSKLLEGYNTDVVPSGVVDLVVPGERGYEFLENQDFGSILRKHKKAVVFAVPGAFTPTCNGKHLPGFVEQAVALRGKGIEEIYCLSVNDKYVMRAWADSTPRCFEERIIMIADGNAEFTIAINAANDKRSGRMGLRSQRYAFILQDGLITKVFKDSSGLANSSASNVLAYL